MSGENPNKAHKPHTNCQHNGRGVIICAFSTTTTCAASQLETPLYTDHSSVKYEAFCPKAKTFESCSKSTTKCLKKK